MVIFHCKLLVHQRVTSPRRHLVLCHETPSVVSTEAIGGLRQVIGAEAEKLRVLGQFGLLGWIDIRYPHGTVEHEMRYINSINEI